MKILTIVLTDGLYISEYAEIAYKLADTALKNYKVNIFLYLDGVHIPKKDQSPSFFNNTGQLFSGLAEKGVVIRACARCAGARGYTPEEEIVEGSNCKDYFSGIKITSLYGDGAYLAVVGQDSKKLGLSNLADILYAYGELRVIVHEPSLVERYLFGEPLIETLELTDERIFSKK